MPECKVMKINSLILWLVSRFPDNGFYFFYMEVFIIGCKKMPVNCFNRHYYKKSSCIIPIGFLS